LIEALSAGLSTQELGGNVWPTQPLMSATDRDLVEALAGIEHERWAHWQAYLHAQCLKMEDGGLVIPKELVRRWERLISTPYAELTEQEQQSDRDQVHRYLPLILQLLGRAPRV